MTPALREITGFDDPALPQVLDLYQASFPPREQVRLSWWINLLSEKSAGLGEGRHLVARVSDSGVDAFAYWEEGEAADFLWYLATREELRGQGVGAEMFREICKSIFARSRPLIFEVELPEQAARFSKEDRVWAERRIAWYRRNGARLLGGIEYAQDVGWQPVLPMGLMLAARAELSPEEAFASARAVVGDQVRQVGRLELT